MPSRTIEIFSTPKSTSGSSNLASDGRFELDVGLALMENTYMDPHNTSSDHQNQLETYLQYMRDLVALDPRSMRALATTIGADQSNLSSFLQRGEDLARGKVGELYRALRLSRIGDITPEVRAFAVGDDIQPLRRVIETLADSPRIVAIAVKGEPLWDTEIPFDGAMYGVWSASCRICITRTLRRGGRGIEVPGITPEALGHLVQWRKLDREKNPTVFARIPQSRVSRWVSGDLSSKEFDAIVNAGTMPTIADIEELAGRGGVSLSFIYDFVATHMKSAEVLKRGRDLRRGGGEE